MTMMTLKIEINGREIDRIDIVNVTSYDGGQYVNPEHDTTRDHKYAITHYNFAEKENVKKECAHKKSDGRMKLIELVCQALLNNGKNSPIQKKRKSKAR